MTTTTEGTRAENARLAYALARIGLGLNIMIHGLSRLPNLSGFAHEMNEALAKSPLPPALVHATSYGIPVAEAVIGALVLFGLKLRAALVAGTLVMLLVLAGACSAQSWNVAAMQMTYLAFYVALIATLHHDAFSIDARHTRAR